MRYLRRALSVFFVIVLAIVIWCALHVWRGPRRFEEVPDAPPDAKRVVAAARRLIGAPYDVLQGGQGDLLGRLGFLVCADVVTIAYGESGFALDALLRQEASADPEAFGLSGPVDEAIGVLSRRSRCLWTLAQRKGWIVRDGDEATIADIIFYARGSDRIPTHCAVVSRLRTDGYDVIEATMRAMRVRECSDKSVEERGYHIVAVAHPTL